MTDDGVKKYDSDVTSGSLQAMGTVLEAIRQPTPMSRYRVEELEATIEVAKKMAGAQAGESLTDAIHRLQMMAPPPTTMVDMDMGTVWQRPPEDGDTIASLRTDLIALSVRVEKHAFARVTSQSMNSDRWMGLRPEVQAFATAMESKLRANDHKGGWRGDTVLDLLARLGEELVELGHACSRSTVKADEVTREAADVANFAMMIADVVGGLKSGGGK